MTQKPTLIITGSSSGIGKAATLRLLEAGYHIIGISRRAGQFTHADFQAIDMDLAKPDELPKKLEQITAQHSQIDGIIFCAGSGRFGSLEEFSYQQIRSVIDLNLSSQIYLTRAFLPILKKQNSGDLIYIGSEAALSGGKRGAVYSAAKFGLRGFTQALRQECASNNIRVTLINPGMVRTEFFNTLDFSPGADTSNAIEPQDIAEMILSVLKMRPGTVIDEINLSPQKNVIRFGNK
ncbi:MAG: SDR family oxidoreductase [Gammaproteobacteria bacterium]|nr:SDR family oxidoreductase [Gammaproteobacteria bacterium]